MQALIGHESQYQPYAIGINGSNRLNKQPNTRDEAIIQAKTLRSQGIDFDAGLAQINVRNWDWLKLNAETVFDPCTNLQAAQTVLTHCYSRAVNLYSDEQQALQAALSCYNTGHLERGFQNGYVGKVLAQAGIKIPGLLAPKADKASNVVKAETETGAEAKVETKDPPKPAASEPPPATRGDRDGFVSNPAPDGFSQPSEPQRPTSTSTSTSTF
jgi:type IV secretion system protein VirB1